MRVLYIKTTSRHDVLIQTEKVSVSVSLEKAFLSETCWSRRDTNNKKIGILRTCASFWEQHASQTTMLASATDAMDTCHRRIERFSHRSHVALHQKATPFHSMPRYAVHTVYYIHVFGAGIHCCEEFPQTLYERRRWWRRRRQQSWAVYPINWRDKESVERQTVRHYLSVSYACNAIDQLSDVPIRKSVLKSNL